jgi:hypothetical protein
MLPNKTVYIFVHENEAQKAFMILPGPCNVMKSQYMYITLLLPQNP